MFDSWWRQIGLVGGLLFFFVVLWAATNLTTSLIALSIVLLLYLLHHLRHIARLRAWLLKPAVEHVPHGLGIWDEIFARLYQMGRVTSRSQQHLSRVVERFQSAARAIPDGIILLNEVNQIEWCNPVAEKQLNIDNEHDRGQFITYLLRPTQFTEYISEQNYSEPLVLHAVPNANIALSIQLVPFGDKQKLLISRDITHLERVETMRRDFVANVSHELRTPLTVLTGFLETFAGMSELSHADVQHYHDLMREQGQRMQRLVEDLLALSRLESSQNHEELPVKIPDLLRQLIHEARSLSSGRHNLKLELASHAELLGNADELRSAFSNLISNAVRYTPNGGEIVLRWQVTEQAGIFSVQDSGEGIEAHHIPRLTERFYRVDRSRSRETGGTGLGLSIVKHVLSRHKAQLDIRSTPGEGSTFSAVFPLKQVLQANETRS